MSLAGGSCAGKSPLPAGTFAEACPLASGACPGIADHSPSAVLLVEAEVVADIVVVAAADGLTASDLMAASVGRAVVGRVDWRAEHGPKTRLLVSYHPFCRRLFLCPDRDRLCLCCLLVLYHVPLDLLDLLVRLPPDCSPLGYRQDRMALALDDHWRWRKSSRRKRIYRPRHRHPHRTYWQSPTLRSRPLVAVDRNAAWRATRGNLVERIHPQRHLHGQKMLCS